MAVVVVIFPSAAVAVYVPEAAAQAGNPATEASAQERRHAPHGRVLPEPEPGGRRYEATRRYQAAEARQGVAVDEDHFYAIANYRIASYRRDTGARVAEWDGGAEGPLIHLNSCIVVEERLMCAHSNYPGVPMLSSIEYFDRATLEHVDSHSFGVYEGSLTWVIPHDGDWWAAFAHYGNSAGVPDRGSAWTSLVRFDEDWNRKEEFAFPVALIDRFSPYSTSGGNWGPDGLLYVSGHDAAEIYVLRLPTMGSVLEWIDTIPAPIEGQAWVFDSVEPETIWGIVRSTGEVVQAKPR